MNIFFRAMLIAFALFAYTESNAQEYKFDPNMLGKDVAGVDVSLFNSGAQPPGVYKVKIIINNHVVDTKDVEFKNVKNKDEKYILEPVISNEELSYYGIKIDKYDGYEHDGLTAIPGARYIFNFSSMELIISVPQVALRTTQKGIAPMEMWDDGIPALMLNYDVVNTSSSFENSKSSYTYARLNPGVNLGPWRLRNQTNWDHNEHSQTNWKVIHTYLERDIKEIKSNVVIGDTTTQGNIFESFPMRGLRVGTDEDMSPYNQRAYAPEVRGIARSNARVEIKRNGYVIYNTTVPPGQFEIDDIPLSGGAGGELEVTVWEADGSSQVFRVPYQTPAISVKRDYFEYATAVGKYRSTHSDIEHGDFGQATFIYGLPIDVTVYSGAQYASNFFASTLGLGKSFGEFGSLSLDYISSSANTKLNEKETGGAWRARYSKNIESTKTTASLTTQNYTSSGYNNISEVLGELCDVGYDCYNYNNGKYKKKSAASFQLTQQAGSYGAVSITGSHKEYWGRGSENDFSVNYSLDLKYANLKFGLAESNVLTKKNDFNKERQLTFWVNIPLNDYSRSPINATYQLISSTLEGDSNEIGINGNSFDRQLSWDVRQRYGRSMDTSSARGAWLGRYGKFGGDYTHSNKYSQLGFSVAGGAVLHGNGITLTQSLGETNALIETPGVAGAGVGGWPGVKTDFRGFTAKSYLVPYKENIIEIDPAKLPKNAEITQTDKKVIPTRGALVFSRFETRVGGKVIMILNQENGKNVPFGSLVTLGNIGTAGIVGENGQVYLTGLPSAGTLVVKFGRGACTVSYSLQENKELKGIYKMHEICKSFR